MAIDIDLEGKVALVTGAGRGIGRAIAIGLAEAGANVCVTARTEVEIDETAEKVRGLGRSALAVPADATDGRAVNAVIEQTIAALGGLQILVNNAGIDLPKPLLDIDEDGYDRVMDTNVKSMFLFTRAAGRHMIPEVRAGDQHGFSRRLRRRPQSGDLPCQQGGGGPPDQGDGDRVGAA
jgi:NAD(P)-dependent dehydrogenase (short-subunit alcohol dehydrogenase family)